MGSIGSSGRVGFPSLLSAVTHENSKHHTFGGDTDIFYSSIAALWGKKNKLKGKKGYYSVFRAASVQLKATSESV